MRVLFIGWTGIISTACTRRALEKNLEVYHLNRGSHPEKAPKGVTTLRADVRNADEDGWIPTCFGSRDYTVARRMLDGKEIVVPGDGQSLWTLTHASDFARGFTGLLGNPTAIGQAFHITSDESLTWLDAHPDAKMVDPAVNGEYETVLEGWARAMAAAGGLRGT
jgi:nucleoside-diphosphate-sugar epimerase